jgi:FkbM family methyltransferase
VDPSEWRPGTLDRTRGFVRRAVSLTLGDHTEEGLRGVYHRVLRRTGRFGPPEDETTAAVLAAAAARSRTIFDIGANVGRYAWFLQRHASSRSMLFAFEPHPAAARLLRGAVGTSARCKVLEVAAADRDGNAELVVPGGPFGSPVSALAWVRGQDDAEDARTLRVATRRIDSLIEDGTISVTARSS